MLYIIEIIRIDTSFQDEYRRLSRISEVIHCLYKSFLKEISKKGDDAMLHAFIISVAAEVIGGLILAFIQFIINKCKKTA